MMRLIFLSKCPILAASAFLICWLSVPAAAQQIPDLPQTMADDSDADLDTPSDAARILFHADTDINLFP